MNRNQQIAQMTARIELLEAVLAERDRRISALEKRVASLAVWKQLAEVLKPDFDLTVKGKG